MKKLVVMLCLVLVFSTGVFAAEGNPDSGLTTDIPTYVEVGPYASVVSQRVVVEPSGWWYRWNEAAPGMDFGHYSGQAGYGKVADSNCFILETNTNLLVTFKGESLKHASGDKMLTRYWAWTSRGVDDLPNPYLLLNVPDQIRPYHKIGYFGEAGKAPRKDSGRWVEDVLFDVFNLLGMNYWPTGEWADEVQQEWHGVTTNGFYAFQVFGFASTDDISSQREGDYVGKIILTVSK